VALLDGIITWSLHFVFRLESFAFGCLLLDTTWPVCTWYPCLVKASSYRGWWFGDDDSMDLLGFWWLSATGSRHTIMLLDSHSYPFRMPLLCVLSLMWLRRRGNDRTGYFVRWVGCLGLNVVALFWLIFLMEQICQQFPPKTTQEHYPTGKTGVYLGHHGSPMLIKICLSTTLRKLYPPNYHQHQQIHLTEQQPSSQPKLSLPEPNSHTWLPPRKKRF